LAGAGDQRRGGAPHAIGDADDAAGNDGESSEDVQVEIPDEVLAASAQDVHRELAECKDRLLRLQAEMENLRRRTAREVQDERRYGPLPLVRDLLGVLDNVDRAVESGERATDAAGLLEGFRLVAKQLRTVLEKHQVVPITAKGEAFDPNLHEAILQQPSEAPIGTVIMVTQEGYRLYDRVVRPSQVIVSAGVAEEER
jgi:molecular chaperone GrpE